MPILLAGQPVVVDHLGKLEEYLRLRLPSMDWPFQREQDRNLTPVDGHLPRFPALPPCRITELQLPGGYFSRYGRSLQVVDQVHMPAILQAAWEVTWNGTDPLPSGPKDNKPITLSYQQDGQQVWANLYLLTPIQLDALTNPRQLWLLPLVGEEYYQRNEPITLSCTSTTTWSDLIGQAAEIGGFLAPNKNYLQPDPGLFDTDGSPKATTLDLLAGSVGARYAQGVTAGQKDLQTPSQAAAALADAWASLPTPILGGKLPTGPELGKLTMRLRKLVDHRPGIPDQYAKAETDPGLTPPINYPEAVIDAAFYLEHYHTAGAGTQAIGVAPVNQPPIPVTVESNPNISLSEEQASRDAADSLADQLLTDLAAWHDEAFEVTWAGVVHQAQALLDSAYTDFVSVRYDGNDNQPDIVTRAKSLDPFIRPAVNFCQTGGLYVHATEVAHLQIQGSEGLASFPDDSKSEHAYDGTPKNFALADHDPNDLRPPDEELDAYWQLNQGWAPIATTQAEGETQDYIRVKVTEDLYGTNSPVMDWTTAESRSQDPDFVVPVAQPPVTNPLRVDCRTEGYIWISRYTYKVDDEVFSVWYCVFSEHPKARHLEVEVIQETGGTGSKQYYCTIERYYRGVHPVATEDNDNFLVDLSVYSDTIQPVDQYWQNLDQGDRIRLIYDTNNNIYFYGGTIDFIARWVLGTVTWTPYAGLNTNVTINVTDHWEGYDPGSSVDAVMPGALNYSCSEPVTAKCIASWSPEEKKYNVTSTDSAWLGPPKNVAVPTGTMTPVSDSLGGKTCYMQNINNVLVFDCDAEGPQPVEMFCIDGKQTMPDLDICWWVYWCSGGYNGPDKPYGGGSCPGSPCDPYPDPYPNPDDPDYVPGPCDYSCADCKGDCWFEWYDTDDISAPYWVLVEETCEGEHADCDCIEPNYPGDFPFQIVRAPCGQKPNRDDSTNCADHSCLWEVSGGVWVPVADQGCPEGCTCAEPAIDPATLNEGDQRGGSCDAGAEDVCVGDCVWRMGSNYEWQLVGDNCGPPSATCGCHTPPDWGAPPGTEVRHDCTETPSFAGNCTDTACVWYSNGTAWIPVDGQSCATTCPCPGPPATDPTSVPIGSREHVLCQEQEDCVGRECLWEYLPSFYWVARGNNCTTVPGCECYQPNWHGTVGETITLTCGEVNDPPPVTCDNAKCVVEYTAIGWMPVEGWTHCATGCSCPDMPTDTPVVGTRRALDCPWECGCPNCGAGGNPQEAWVTDIDWSGDVPGGLACCEHCEGQAVEITDYYRDEPMSFDAVQNGQSTEQGNCTWTIPVHVREYNTDDPGIIENEYDTTVNATYNGTQWTLTSGSTPAYGYDMNWLGNDDDCSGPTVGSFGETASFNTIKTACPGGGPGGPIRYRLDPSREQVATSSCSWDIPVIWSFNGGNIARWVSATYAGTEWQIDGGGDPFGLGLSGSWTNSAPCATGFTCVADVVQPNGCSSFADQPPALENGQVTFYAVARFCAQAAAEAEEAARVANLERARASAEGPGDLFRAMNPDLFKDAGCPCNDTAGMMNAWQIDKVRRRTRFLAENMVRAFERRKRPDLVEEYTVAVLTEMITAALDQWQSEQAEETEAQA